MDADPELLVFDEKHTLGILCNLLDLQPNAYFRDMFRTFRIIWSSFKVALQEFRSNKLRTFLSLLGIIIGIFCIISVLSTISSMQRAVNNDLKQLGNKAIYVDKWLWSGGPDCPWWKYIKRPTPKYDEMRLLRLKLPNA